MAPTLPKLLFIINSRSGNQKTDWKEEITRHFPNEKYWVELYDIPDACRPETIKEKIGQVSPDRVIAVGGDGTVKMVAECLLKSLIPLGILPAGSANGMAKELGIPDIPSEAMDTIMNGEVETIHLVKINDEYCIHLSDIGFNALVVKTFEEGHIRGMWGYMKATWKTLLSHRRMRVEINVGGQNIIRQAVMVVIANASSYGTGVMINPVGSLFDDLFEVVIIKKISINEILKARFTSRGFNPEKIELLQTHSLKIRSKSRIHFQVDGEYRGRLNLVEATIVPQALHVIVGAKKK